jgi:hypothetical protein
MSRDSGEKAVVRIIAIAVATFFEYAVSEIMERVFEWARARTKRD